MSDHLLARQLDAWLDEVVEREASDIDFLIGSPPILKIGALRVRMDQPPLTDHLMLSLVNVLYPNAAEEMARSRKGVAAAYRRVFRNLPVGHPDRGKALRFRVNIIPGEGPNGGFGLHITMRSIPMTVPLPKDIGLPEDILPYFRHRDGLVLVTGPTNCHAPGHLIRLADNSRKPIEAIHPLRDLIMGWDYLPRRIRAIHRGEAEMVTIRGVDDGMPPIPPFQVTADHLLPVVLHSKDMLRNLHEQLLSAGQLPEDKKFYLVQRAREQFLLRTCIREPGVRKGPFVGLELAQFTDKLYQDGLGVIHHNSGKSTALASVIRYQTSGEESLKVLTLENPIEFPLAEMDTPNATIYQVEVPTHIHSFRRGIEENMRHSPDIIVVGEMRDAETMSAGILASVTGHQVMGTLHSTGFANTINRVVNNLPPEDAAAMRHDLIDSLRLVFTQRLLPTPEGKRTAVREWLVCDSYVRKKLHEAAEKNTLQKTGHELVWRFGRPIMDDVEAAYREGRILEVDHESFRRDFGGK